MVLFSEKNGTFSERQRLYVEGGGDKSRSWKAAGKPGRPTLFMKQRMTGIIYTVLINSDHYMTVFITSILPFISKQL